MIDAAGGEAGSRPESGSAAASQLRHRRVLLKLSVEALLGSRQYGVDPEFCAFIAQQVATVHALGVQVGIVVGGGNIFRGLAASARGMDRSTGDYIGMLATVMNGVIAVEIWQQLPVAAFVLAAGLASLPVDLYKAAAVDGSSTWQTCRMITLPLLKPVILVVLLLRIMDAFKVFDIVFMLTYGGPGQVTQVLSLLIYKTGLKFLQVGQASAMSWLFLAFIFVMSFFFIRELQRGEA